MARYINVYGQYSTDEVLVQLHGTNWWSNTEYGV